MFACSPDHQLMAGHQAATIATQAFPTPSPSPPWERGLNQPATYFAVTPPPAGTLLGPTHAPAVTATLLGPTPAPITMAQIMHSPGPMMVLPATNPTAKDSRWLTLEVCREFQRSKCSRPDNECKFAHPAPHVEIQNGRVVACYDSIKGKCQRKEPPCKYLHPPQHLREQLLQNGRNNLILKNMQIQAYHQHAQYASVLPVASYPSLQALSAVPAHATSYSPYITSVAMPPNSDSPSIMSQQLAPSLITTKAVRADKFENSSMESCETVTTHAPLMDTFSYSTYFTQHSAVPGMVPAFKRIAVADVSKGAGIPVYHTNHLLPSLQPTSLMQVQHQSSYIPVSFPVAGHPPSVPRY